MTDISREPRRCDYVSPYNWQRCTREAGHDGLHMPEGIEIDDPNGPEDQP